MEPCPVGGLEGHFEVGAGVVVVALPYLAMLVKPGQGGAVLEVYGKAGNLAAGGHQPVKHGIEPVQTLAGQRRDRDCRLTGGTAGLGQGMLARPGIQQIDLVQHFDQPGVGLGVDLQVPKDAMDVVPLGLTVGVREVADVKDDVGGRDLLKGGAKGRHQRRRQVGNEPNRVREDDLPARGQRHRAHGRVQGGEQQVLGEDLGAGHPIEQG